MSERRPRIKHLLNRLTVLVLAVTGFVVFAILMLSNYSAQLAQRSEQELLPSIHEHQRAALNLERLERMGDLVAYGADLALIRRNALAAQVLAYQPSFDFDPKTQKAVREAYDLIKALRIVRQQYLNLPISQNDRETQVKLLQQKEQTLQTQWGEHKQALFELQNRIITDATALQAQTLQKISQTSRRILIVGMIGVGLFVIALAVAATLLRRHLVVPVTEASHALLAIESGKPHHLHRARYDEIATIHHAVDRLSSTMKKLHDMATTDSLTGCYNRRYFMELAQAELMTAHHRNAPLTLMMMDLDHFKRVNDEYGHATGDETLKLCTQWIRDLLPEGCFLGRLGGEEFAVLLTHHDRQASMALAETIRACLSEQSAQQSTIPHFTVSIGIESRYYATDTVDSLLSLADKALYQAKSSGRNRVVFRERNSVIEPS